ncbi:tetratricopeptide repeat protein, partial [bacterium]|nr:tetratricopeptide repeat protein [bacterium]
ANYVMAFDCFSLALQIDEMLGNEGQFVYDYINIGATYHNRSFYDEAIDYKTKALNLAKDIDDFDGILSGYNHLGWASADGEKYYIAIDYYTLGIEYAQKIDEEDEEEFFNLIIAEVYDFGLEDWETAIEYYEKALSIAKEQGEMADVQRYLYYVGECDEYLLDQDMADYYYNEADAIIIEDE